MKADLVINKEKLVNVNIVDIKPYDIKFLWKGKYIKRNMNIIIKYNIGILDYNAHKDEYLCEYKDNRFNIHTKKQALFDGDGLMLKSSFTRVRNRLQNFMLNNVDKLNENEKRMFIDIISDLDWSIMKMYKEVDYNR